jgi:hypothetical protein
MEYRVELFNKCARPPPPSSLTRPSYLSHPRRLAKYLKKKKKPKNPGPGGPGSCHSSLLGVPNFHRRIAERIRKFVVPSAALSRPVLFLPTF